MKLHIIRIIFFILIFNKTYSQEEILQVGSNADEIVKRIEMRDKDRIGMRLPVFIADVLDGSVFNSLETKKITFYYFWSNCGDPCFGMFPIFNEIQKEYNGKVNFISITYQNKNQLQEIIEEQPFTFKHCIMAESEIEILRLSTGYPTTIIALDGIIIFCKSGGPITSDSRNELRDKLKIIINQNLE